MKKLLILLIVVILGVGGYFGYQHWQSDKTSKTGVQSDKQHGNQSSTDSPVSDPYANWGTYSNQTYGLSFRYPAIWEVSEGAFDLSQSATKQEYAVDIKRAEDAKYNDTISLEILAEPLATATTWYDNYFAQSSLNTVTKSSNSLKGKQSAQYIVSNTGTTTKLYIFEVGNKSYVFSSINEELNAQYDSDYWTKFDKTFDSLHFN